MKATELIKRLQDLVDEHGDRCVTIDLGRNYDYADDVDLHWDSQTFTIK